MIFLLRLASRNLFRHRLRTVLSMSAVIAGVWVLVMGRAFLRGMNENIIRAEEDTFSGHVLVRPVGYPTAPMSHPVDGLVQVDGDLAAWLDANTVAWTARTLFTPWVVAGGDSLRVRAFGFDPASDAAVFPRGSWRVTGAIPERAADGVLMSTGLARLLHLEVGDRVVLKARTSQGALNALDVPVAGVVGTGNPAIDALGVFVPAPLVQDLVRNDGGASHVAVRLDRRALAEPFAEELRARVGDAMSVSTWHDEVRDILQVQAIRQRALDILVFVLLAMSAAAIANTILMAAYERIREIGTLRAMGMTRRQVLALFVIEGALLGLAGGGIGATIAAYQSYRGATVGIDLSSMLENAPSSGTLPFSVMLYLEYSPTMIGRAVVFGVVVAMLASVYPAIVAARLAPADAVRAK